jgi:hypothetical protein
MELIPLAIVSKPMAIDFNHVSYGFMSFLLLFLIGITSKYAGGQDVWSGIPMQKKPFT